jgi:hypothetical protein
MSAIAQSQRRKATHQSRRSSTGDDDARLNAAPAHQIALRSTSSAPAINHQNRRLSHPNGSNHRFRSHQIQTDAQPVAVKSP